MMQKINYEVSKAELSDAYAISLIEKNNFSEPWSENQIAEEILKENCIFLSAKSDNKLIGYISGQLILDEFYISNIAVDINFRKNGVAYSLINCLLAELKKINCIFATLEVRISNTPAKNLYEKCGFRLLGIRKSFYSKPIEDAAIYTCYFNSEEEKYNENISN